jgi:MtN3 and saliva related transmembrane protein
VARWQGRFYKEYFLSLSMVHSNFGLRHFSKRKKRSFIDKLIYVFAIGGPLMNIPQLLKIWTEKNSSGVSVISWIGFSLTALIWLVYGIIHKEKPIIVANILYFVLQVGVIIGALAY